MTGRVVDSLEVSERFLWDLRKTIAELLNDNYAGRLREARINTDCNCRSRPMTTAPSTTCRTPAAPTCRWASFGWGARESRLAGQWPRQRIPTARPFRRRGLHGRQPMGPMEESSLLAEGARRPDVLRGREPFCLPPLRPPTVARPQSRHDDGDYRRSLRADPNLVGADAAVARVSGPLQLPAAPGAVCGGHLLPPNRKRAERHGPRRPHRIRIRRLSAGSRAHPDVG